MPDQDLGLGRGQRIEEKFPRDLQIERSRKLRELQRVTDPGPGVELGNRLANVAHVIERPVGALEEGRILPGQSPAHHARLDQGSQGLASRHVAREVGSAGGDGGQDEGLLVKVGVD